MTVECPPAAPSRALNIGLCAYAALPNLVFVRVPNERGRWLLTDRCVVEVDCPHCLSVAGEPCKSSPKPWSTPTSLRYHTGVHTYRRNAGRKKLGWAYHTAPDKPKLRLNAEDIRAAEALLEEGAL